MNRLSFQVPEEASTTLVRARALATKILGRIRRRGPDGSANASEPDLLRVGQVVDGRYRVLRLIDRGGVGQVYLVEDLELGEEVALKTLHQRFAGSPKAIEQFKREVALSRRVTHENVCRLFDLGRQESSETGRDSDLGEESFYFVTMEFLDGETLRDRLQREGLLGLGESLGLAVQVARGIQAAHRKGVVHRDIKGSNILLVKTSGDSTRAVVTDFGLAGTVEVEAASTPSRMLPRVSSRGPSPLEGTPLFMAPEQVAGEEVSAASDIYSFGVLLYHMVTGRWPFEGTSAVSTALARLNREPVPPSRYVADLDGELEGLIYCCLEREPASRFASMAALLEALEELQGKLQRNQPPRDPLQRKERQPQQQARGRRRWLRRWGWAAALLSIVPVLLLGWFTLDLSDRPGGVAEKKQGLSLVAEVRPSLAILPLGILSSEGPFPEASVANLRAEGIGVALGEGLAASLAAGEELRVVNVDQREELRAELVSPSGLRRALPEIDRFDATWTLRGLLEVGSSQEEDGAVDQPLTLRLQLERQHGDPAEFSFDLTGTPEGMGELVEQAGLLVRERLSLDLPTGPQLESARAELPNRSDAAILYAQGLAALRGFDTVLARRNFEAALEKEPDHPLVLSALGGVLSSIGYKEQAAEVAERAFRNAGDLSRERQLAIEARYRLTIHEWDRATELFRALHEFFPDDFDYGLELAVAQGRGAHLEAAFTTLERLRQMPRPSGADPRLDLAEAKISYHNGDYDRSQAAAARAKDAARTSGRRLLLARALGWEAITRVYMDSPAAEVEALLQEALVHYRQVGHKSGETETLLTLGVQARNRGELERAEVFIERAIALANETGNLASQARGLATLAVIHDLRGELSQGLGLKKQVLENYRQRNVRQGEAIMLENIGISLLKMGRPAESLEYVLLASERFSQMGDEIGVAWSPYRAGRAWFDLGDLELASNSFERALEAAVDHPEGGLVEATKMELARIAAARGEAAVAEQSIRELLEEYARQEQPLSVSESHLVLAQILLERGEFARARQLAGEALAFFDLEGLDHASAEAQTVVTQTRLQDYLADLGSSVGVSGDGTAGSSAIAREALTTSCDDLEARLSHLEHRRIALLGQVVLAQCSLVRGAAPSEVVALARSIITEAEDLQLAEPVREAICLEAELLEAMGITQGRPLPADGCLGRQLALPSHQTSTATPDLPRSPASEDDSASRQSVTMPAAQKRPSSLDSQASSVSRYESGEKEGLGAVEAVRGVASHV